MSNEELEELLTWRTLGLKRQNKYQAMMSLGIDLAMQKNLLPKDYLEQFQKFWPGFNKFHRKRTNRYHREMYEFKKKIGQNNV